MAKTLGYMITWTTYGTWLQGGEKGFVKNGVVRQMKNEFRNPKSETNSNNRSTKFKMRFEIAAVPLHKWRVSGGQVGGASPTLPKWIPANDLRE